MAILRLTLLGSFKAFLDHEAITGFESNKVRALLAYLAAEAERPSRRATLADLIWPEWPEKSAMRNLSFALADLRKNIADSLSQPPFLLINRDGLQLNPASQIQVDLWDFIRLGKTASTISAERPSQISQLKATIELYHGPFLEGFSLADSVPFEEWLATTREQVNRHLVQALGDLAEAYLGQGEYEQGMLYARRRVELEPWLEEGHQQLMRLLAMTGQRSVALAQFEKCRRVLETELGVKPGATTLELYEQIRDGKLTVVPPVGISATAKIPSFSILTHEPELSKPTSSPTLKNNLPVQLTSFIGREKEIVQVQEILTQHSLVTLTGSGGIGKTRLALQVAAGLLDAYPDGVWLVQFAPLADPALIPQTVIGALGLVEQAGKTPTVYLSDYLHSKRLLLILDNCEHLVATCAELASVLLQSATRLTILATSREILGVAGEIPYRVPSLGMPDSNHLPLVEGLSRFDAVRLFVERARVVSPGFIISPFNAADVVQITQRLDGIPLALELAAARLRLLSVNQIALHLDDAFRLLTGGPRTALPRHQTLRALIDWSYDLLSEGERKLLRSLSVFTGGWTLEAADAICGDDQDVLDLLGGLADKSLILAAPDLTGEMRYRMLETVRQYAHTCLVEAGEAEVVRQRHLGYYLNLAEKLEPNLRGREQIPTLDYWEGELDNLRLALEWALHTDIQAELRLAASLQWFWHIRTHWAEAASWLEQGLAAELINRNGQPLAGARAVVRARALTALGLHIFVRGGNLEKATSVFEEAVTLLQVSGPENSLPLAWALVRLAECKLGDSNPLQAKVLADEALGLFRESGETLGITEGLRILAEVEIDPVQVKRICQEWLAIEEAIGNPDGIATALLHRGFAQSSEGNYKGAYASLGTSREHYRRVGNPDAVARGSFFLAYAAQFDGDLERAIFHLDEALGGFREIESDVPVAFCLFFKYLFTIKQGRYDQIVALNEESIRISQKTQDPDVITDVLYQRAHLARLLGETEEARQLVEERLPIGGVFGSKAFMFVEMGHLAIQEEDLVQAGIFCRESLQFLIRQRNMIWIGFPLDGLAVLAARQGKLERAARLFGTSLWRGYANLLSPIERAERDADFTTIAAVLGEERFAQLREEGFVMPFMQVLALAQAED